MDKKAAQNRKRQQDFRDRMKRAGYTQRTLWVHEDDVDRLAEFVQGLKSPTDENHRG